MSVRARFRLDRDGFRLDADLEAPGTGVTALFGRSGAGKTTLLRAIAGLEPCREGYLEVDGEVWQDESRNRPVHRRPLGFVFQEPSLFDHLPVRRNLEYGLRRVAEPDRRVTLGEAVAWLGIGSLLDRMPVALSAGERQRVAIARALLTSPRLLLMDEPLASLDRESKAEILPYVESLQRRLSIPVLYVSHSLDEVARIADHLALMEAGRIRAVGPVGELLTRLDLPLARGDEAEALVEATVSEHDEDHRLTALEFPGGRFWVARREIEPGTRVALRILARDVSLTLERQTGTSILNIVPVVVTDLVEAGPAEMIARLDASGVPLLSRVTRRSAAALALRPGARVFAQVKSVALLD